MSTTRLLARRATLLFWAILIAAITTGTSSARIWTDQKGRKVEADYVAFVDGKVIVRRNSDGKLFEVPLNLLSEADQVFVRSQTGQKGQVEDTKANVASSMPALSEPSGDVSSWISENGLSDQFSFAKNYHDQNPVAAFFVIDSLKGKDGAPQTLVDWVDGQKQSMLRHVKAIIATDLASAKEKGDLRVQLHALMARAYMDEASRKFIDPDNVTKEDMNRAYALADDLRPLIEKAVAATDRQRDVWRVEIEIAHQIDAYTEEVGADNWSVPAPEGHVLVGVRGTVTNISAQPDLPYAIWRTHPEQAAAICADSKVFERGVIPGNARLISQEDFGLLSPAGYHQCCVVGEDCEFLGLFRVLRAVGECKRPTASCGKFLRQDESCVFDLYFPVPKGQTDLRLLVWGSAPIGVTAKPASPSQGRRDRQGACEVFPAAPSPPTTVVTPDVEVVARGKEPYIGSWEFDTETMIPYLEKNQNLSREQAERLAALLRFFRADITDKTIFMQSNPKENGKGEYKVVKKTEDRITVEITKEIEHIAVGEKWTFIIGDDSLGLCMDNMVIYMKRKGQTKHMNPK